MKKFSFYGKVFHDLRGKFHKIPINVRSAHAFEACMGEHAVQGVPEFVQECGQCKNVVTSEKVSNAGLSGVGFVKFMVTDTCGRLSVPSASVHCSL